MPPHGAKTAQKMNISRDKTNTVNTKRYDETPQMQTLKLALQPTDVLKRRVKTNSPPLDMQEHKDVVLVEEDKPRELLLQYLLTKGSAGTNHDMQMAVQVLAVHEERT